MTKMSQIPSYIVGLITCPKYKIIYVRIIAYGKNDCYYYGFKPKYFPF